MLNDNSALSNRRGIFFLRHVPNERQGHIRPRSCPAYPFFFNRDLYGRFTVPDIKLRVSSFFICSLLDPANGISVKIHLLVVAVLVDRHDLRDVFLARAQCAWIISTDF